MKYKIGLTMLAAALLAFAGIWTLNDSVKANAPQEKDKESEVGAYLGVYLGSVSEAAAKRLGLAEKEGALISSVMPGSPAADAGLKRNDLVISVNGRKISSPDDLVEAVKSYQPGDTIDITFIRNNLQQTLTAVLEKKKTITFKTPYIALRKSPGNVIVGRPFKENFRIFAGRAYLGIEYKELNPDLGSYFGMPEGKGILVTNVKEDSAAGKAGMKAGDVILSIDGKEITDAGDMRNALWQRGDDDKEFLEVIVMRHNERVTLNVEVEKSGFHKLFISPRDFEGHLELLDEHLEDLDFDFDFEIPEIHIEPFENFGINAFISGIESGIGNLCIVLPDGLSFRLEIHDDGTVTFNDKEFDSVEEFKEYMKSEEFKDLKREIQEKTEKTIEEKLKKIRMIVKKRAAI